MARLRAVSQDAPASSLSEAPSKTRADILSETADAAKRGAIGLVDREVSRGRTMAGLSAGVGLAALGLCGVAALGFGEPHFLGILGGIAVLVPTAFAFSKATDSDGWMAEANVDRGLCQAIAVHGKRLGDNIGATDERNIAITPDALINSQLDLLFRDLERSKQRLMVAGADVGLRRAPVRPNERVVPDQNETVVINSDARRFPVYIADVSQTDINVRGVLPPMGSNELVQIGARKARLTGLNGNRAAFQFVNPIVASELNRKIII